MANSTHTGVKVAWIGAAGVIIAALIGVGSVLLKKEDHSSSVNTLPTTQTSHGGGSPNVQGVKGAVTIHIENKAN